MVELLAADEGETVFSVSATSNPMTYINVQRFVVGELQTNCYVVSCQLTKEAVIIDPGFDEHPEAENVFRLIATNGYALKFILNTHGHPDHTCGNGIVKEKFHVPILIHEYDAHILGETGKKIAEFFGFTNFSPLADKLLRDGDVVKFGRTALKVMHTAGHSAGSISLLGEEEVFSGDTLFAGSIGRVDLPEGSEEDMRLSLKKLAGLPEHFVVYSGHGQATTIGEEKRGNPFLRGL